MDGERTTTTELQFLGKTDRPLSVTLTLEELTAKSMTLAEQHRSLREAKNRLAALKDQEKAVKGGIDWLEGEMEALAAVIEAGEEDRAVPCTWYGRDDLGVKVLLRDDTGQEVDRRPLELLDTRAGAAELEDAEPMDEADGELLPQA